MGKSDRQWENSIIRTKSVIWRKVQKGQKGFEIESKGETKKLGRPHIGLPDEVVDKLSLDPGRDDLVAFVMTKDKVDKHVMLTNYFEARLIDSKIENDPQFLLERVIARVLSLRTKKDELYENLEIGKIKDEEFVQKRKEINEELDRISQSVSEFTTRLRGPQEITGVMENKIRLLNQEYESFFISYTQDMISRINAVSKRIRMLASVYAKELIEENEYLYEQQELKFQLDSLLSTSREAMKILSQQIPSIS